MQKQIQKLSLTFAIALTMLGGFFATQNNALAAVGINKQINFQGKVTNSDGTNVATGSYNFNFRIYTVSSGGAAIWSELSKSLTVTDGIFQTNLGDATALPGSVDFYSDNIYLGIEFNSNGEMNPRVQFTAAPYAFNFDTLDGKDWATPGAIGTTTAAAGTFTNISTTTGGVSIGAGQTYGGAGAVTVSSTTNGLTLDSGNNTLTIASSDTALNASGVATLTLAANTKITNASGNMNFEAAGTGTGNVQIGDGGTTSATPDLLVLDTGSAEPTGSVGAMYYSTALNKFRCYQVSAWTDCIGVSGGAQTPWAQDISAAGYDLGSLSNLGFQETTGAPTGTDVGFSRDNSGDLTGNVLTGKTLNIAVNGTDEFNFSSTGLAFNSNNITGLGTNLTASAGLTIASATASGLTLDSGTTGAISIGDDGSAEAITIGTGAAAKTLTIGSINTTSTTNIQSGSGGINIRANNGSTGAVQIGDGGAASATPDALVLDTGSAAPTGAGATNGAMYYDTGTNKFRCYQNSAWTDCIGTGGGGSPAGSDTQVQFNNAGAFGANAGLTFNSTTQTLGISGTDAEINLTGITNEPSAPAAGTMNLYAKAIAGRMMPKWVGPSGLDSIVQPMIAMNKVAWWNPIGNVATAPTTIGMAAMTVVSNGGTGMTARTVATTNIFTRMKRLGIVSTATAGTLGSLRQGVAQYTIGNAAGLGGFTYVARFGSTDTVTGARSFVGVTSATAAPTNVEPSTLTNAIGMCKLSTSNNWQICYGGSAAQTTIDLGANFPANTASTDMYELILYAPTNVNNSVGYRVTRLGTTYQSSGTLTAATAGTQLPASTTLLAARFWKTNNATASVVGLDIASMYVEVDY